MKLVSLKRIFKQLLPTEKNIIKKMLTQTKDTNFGRTFSKTAHSTKPELRFCGGSNPARGVSKIRNSENL